MLFLPEREKNENFQCYVVISQLQHPWVLPLSTVNSMNEFYGMPIASESFYIAEYLLQFISCIWEKIGFSES